jgi:hypothetical protein
MDFRLVAREESVGGAWDYLSIEIEASLGRAIPAATSIALRNPEYRG